MVIRGEDEGYDIYTCIDKVSEKIETQIHKYRQRLIKRGRGVSRDYVASMPEEHWVEDDKPVRTKTFTTKPMNLEEGYHADEIFSGHSFFVFVNDETNDVTSIYRRKRWRLWPPAPRDPKLSLNKLLGNAPLRKGVST